MDGPAYSIQPPIEKSEFEIVSYPMKTSSIEERTKFLMETT